MTLREQVLNTIVGVLVVVAYIPYIKAILKRETRPSKASWIIWSALSVLTAAGMYQAHTLNAQIAEVAVGDVSIVWLAYKYGTSGWQKIEIFCLVSAALGLIAWAITKDPLVAILIGLVLTVVGSIPTITKTWRFPEQEDKLAYQIMVISCLLEIDAIPTWSISAAAQPFTFLCTAGTILSVIIIRSKRKDAHAEL